MKRTLDWCMIVLFFAILFVPFLLAHREDGRTSDMENRALAGVPHLLNEQRQLNVSYPADFDAWIDDNVRFRTILMELNSTLQYQLFHEVANQNLREGEEGHLFYVDGDKVEEYQHLNLLNEKSLTEYITSMQALNDYLEERDIAFYYMQCFDKYSIYPEYYVEGVNQFGEYSRAQQVVESLKAKSSVQVVPIYESLMEHKEEALLYFRATDPAHWNEQGANLGYTALLHTIQRDFPEAVCLEAQDYELTEQEEYASIYGFEYPYVEKFVSYNIRNPKATELDFSEQDSKGIIRYKEHEHYYENHTVSNQLKILLVGDSFIRQFIKDDIAEGFYETLSIDWLNLTNLDQVLEIYEPDIVVFESAEFCLDNTIPLVSEITYTR